MGTGCGKNINVPMSFSGDRCLPRAIVIECLMDEVPNDKQSKHRWFEASTGTTMFYITQNSVSHRDITEGSGSFGKMVPVVLTSGAINTGDLVQTVQIKLSYWQATTTEKVRC
jgi:hypothetical protein